ncbi:MAG: hypothetical protein IIU80_03760 [Clostridia bacterium]|nr:hypothetical protein [Clostridia bacterium]
MSAKKIFYFALLALAPYLGIAAMYFLSEQKILLLVLIALIEGLTFTLTLICVYKSQKNRWDAHALAKAVMIVKLIHIPAYVMNFVFACLCLMMLFTFPGALIYFITDCIALMMSGLVVTSAMLRAMSENPRICGKYLWIIPLQFVFCADVFATVFLYKKLKEEKENKILNP